MTTQPLSAIVALAMNGTIGRGNELPWKLRSDLQRFRRLTMGHTLIMGRKTFDSIGKPLPGRKTIVLSRQKETKIEGVQVVASLEEAIERLDHEAQGYIVGGAEVYRLAMPLIKTLYLTRVLAEIAGDAYFCNWDDTEFDCIERSYTSADGFNDWPTEFLHLERKPRPNQLPRC